MQLGLNQLSTHLRQKLASCYLLHGDEILLRQEARDLIRQATQRAGFHNHKRLNVENNFNWQELAFECRCLNLFNEKTLIEISNLQSKFDQESTQVLTNYCQNPATDKVLLLISGKLTQAQLKSRWLQAFNQNGVIVAITPVYPQDFARWITQRLQQAELSADNTTIQLLAELTEGNLLACQQAITKLSLLYPRSHITTSQIATVTANNARFTIFELGDYILKGNTERLITILNNLKAEGAEPTLILWLLTRELRQLITMLLQIQQGKSVQQVVATQWQQKQALYKTALHRLSLPYAKQLLQYAHSIDCTIKGLTTREVWQQLFDLSLAMTMQNPSSNMPYLTRIMRL